DALRLPVVAGAVEQVVLNDRVQAVGQLVVQVASQRRSVGQQLVGDLVTVGVGEHLRVGQLGRDVGQRLEARIGPLALVLAFGRLDRLGNYRRTAVDAG